MTKLVTWNCNMAFRKKKDRILRYDPDVLVIQECEAPDTNGDWSAFSDWMWVGEDEHKGLGVFSRNGISLEPAGVAECGGRFTIPIVTDGPMDLLAVWAMDDERNPENRYVGQVHAALRDYREFVDSDTVVLGDFNWNVIWDESPKGPLRGDFSETVDVLNDCGLRSAYHALTDSDFGNEDDSTFFMHKKRERGYHIDYIFAPEEVVRSAGSLSVGAYDKWFDASDHMPVMVEI